MEWFWDFVKGMFIDNPIAPLFKERLFVYLSRFCEFRYCITRHSGFLIGRGHASGDPAVQLETAAQAATPAVTMMIQDGCTPQEMLQHALGGLPLQVLRHVTPMWACDCSRARVSETLVALGAQELRQMITEQQEVPVHCEFCTTEYVFAPQELVQLLHEALAAEQGES